MRLPASPPGFQQLLNNAIASNRFGSVLAAASDRRQAPSQNGRYRHWDTLRNIKPPSDLSLHEWWLGIKLARQASARPLPIKGTNGEQFTFVATDELLQYAHFIDEHCKGEVSVNLPVFEDDARRKRILVNAVIEEATRSSQLEGATTTRRDAKEMIRSGRTPRDRSERMILNNYKAMAFIRERSSASLTPDVIVELQRILTDQTLDNPDEVGRIQSLQDERVAIYYDPDDVVVHQPPPAEELPIRLQQLCDFANEELDETAFIHPVIRAIALHLWLAYDHPFADGNGRTARALFYWSMLKSGYWLVEYMSISRILRDGPTRYGRSFLYVESDSHDATYFLLNQLEVIERAFNEFKDYLRRKMDEVKKIENAIANSERFNDRQLALLQHALRNPNTEYSAPSHARSHNVTLQSARNDLKDLWGKGFLKARTRGRRNMYTPVDNLDELLRK